MALATGSNGGPRTLVVGLGKTGLSVVRHLLQAGTELMVTDTRELPPGLSELQREYPEVPCMTGGFSEEVFSRAERLVVSPGVSLEQPLIAGARARGAEIIGDVELFARVADAPVVAITGSNGKSTVTTLLGLMAARSGRRVATGGNLGTPALDLLVHPGADLYVLELSSFQLESLYSLRAQAAVVLNVSADHMDRYRDLEDYAGAKARAYAGTACCVINRDDPVVCRIAPACDHVTGFTLGRPAAGDFGLVEADGEQWLVRGEQRLLRAGELLLAGRHNIANVLAALALGEAVGLEMESMLQAAREFQGLEHRTQWVAESAGVRWLNDSKATNVGATLAAVAGLPAPIVLLAGGDAKGAELAPLAAGLAGKVRVALLFGRDAGRIEQALAGTVATERVADLRDAVARAASMVVAGDTVLLSPACASLDQFASYEERGHVFMQAVNEVLT